jgi:hypothetical protein
VEGRSVQSASDEIVYVGMECRGGVRNRLGVADGEFDGGEAHCRDVN